MALCKPALYDDFFQVVQNRLKFSMSTLFVLRNVRVFFSRMQKDFDKTAWNSTPLPLSISKQHRVLIFGGQNTLCVSFALLEGVGVGGGGCEKGRGGVDFQVCV